jgi:hypothetical protein
MTIPENKFWFFRVREFGEKGPVHFPDKIPSDPKEPKFFESMEEGGKKLSILPGLCYNICRMVVLSA